MVGQAAIGISGYFLIFTVISKYPLPKSLWTIFSFGVEAPDLVSLSFNESTEKGLDKNSLVCLGLIFCILYFFITSVNIQYFCNKVKSALFVKVLL